ncbi:MAG: DNA mismatch repair protein MutS [Winogradskyella sp.]|uniref:MutS-related protein n=1 Tax=Winogradskyella sp. TaxID=1883156 RepID=UPI0038583F85
MNWILGVVIVLILISLYANHSNKRKRLKIIDYLQLNWGKPKKREEFHFKSIEKYFKNNNHKKEAYHILSDRCAIDLDINETFEIIDRTSSKIGQQYLYYKLRTIGTIESLLKFRDLTSVFETNEELRLKTQLQLNKLNRTASYYFEELVNSKPVEKPKVIRFVYMLSVLSLLCIVLSFFSPFFFIVLIIIFSINLFFHLKNKWNVSGYLDGVSQLSRTLNVAKAISNYSDIKLKFSDTSFINQVEKIKSKTAYISFEKNLDNEFASVIWLVAEFIKVLFNIEYLIFYSFVDSISTKRDALKKLFHFIGEVDCAISVASLKASEFQICEPKFISEKQLNINEVSHPIIENCITNDLNLIDTSLLLTGSNMSGKTTFIRSVAINSILAQTLNICFAKYYAAPFLKLYSSIRITDDLLDNTSYYLKEVLIIKELIEASNGSEPCLFVLDEIFKGTNTVERISGGKAILTNLNKGNNMVLVSTHDIELAELLVKEKYVLYHFSEQIENNELSFDHKLKKGKLKTRNAISILELYGYPVDIIEDARRTEKETFNN